VAGFAWNTQHVTLISRATFFCAGNVRPYPTGRTEMPLGARLSPHEATSLRPLPVLKESLMDEVRNLTPYSVKESPRLLSLTHSASENRER